MHHLVTDMFKCVGQLALFEKPLDGKNIPVEFWRTLRYHHSHMPISMETGKCSAHGVKYVYLAILQNDIIIASLRKPQNYTSIIILSSQSSKMHCGVMLIRSTISTRTWTRFEETQRDRV